MELLIAEMAGFLQEAEANTKTQEDILFMHTLLTLIFTLPSSFFLPFISLIRFYSAFLKACCDSFKAFGLQSGEKTEES